MLHFSVLRKYKETSHEPKQDHLSINGIEYLLTKTPRLNKTKTETRISLKEIGSYIRIRIPYQKDLKVNSRVLIMVPED